MKEKINGSLIRYFCQAQTVLLGIVGSEDEEPQHICTAASNRIAEKIASFMNRETRRCKAYEFFVLGNRPGRGEK